MKKFLTALLLCAMCAALAAPGWAAMSDEEFLNLCQNGTAQEVRAALDAGADVNAKGEYGMTALMAAAWRNSNPEVVNVLLNAGANVNAETENGWTALMAAVRQDKSNPEVLDILLRAGARPDVDTVARARLDEKLKGTDTLTRLEEAGGFSEDDIAAAVASIAASSAASSIVSDLRALKTAALMFYADNVDKCEAPGFNLADVTGTPEKFMAALRQYLDNPDKFGGGLYVLETGEGGKWFVGFKLDGCDEAIREAVKEKLAEKARTTGVLRSRRPDDPYDGKADIVYMIAR